jgi:hypothetical protein
VVDIPKGVRVLNLAMQLPGHCAPIIGYLKDDLRRGIREGNCAEIVGLLRCEDEAQPELPPLTEKLFDRGAAVER